VGATTPAVLTIDDHKNVMATFVQVEFPIFLPLVVKPPDPPSWNQVGDVPDGVTRFYDARACDSRQLAGTNVGLYSLIGNGSAWQSEPGPALSEPFRVIVHRLTFIDGQCSRAYVATEGQGIWHGIYDEGWAWQRVDTNLANAYAVAVRGNSVFAGGDFGLRWATIPAEGHAYDWQTTVINNKLVNSLTVNGNTVFAAAWLDGVYINASPGQNNTWSKLGTGGNTLVYEAVGNELVSLVGAQDGLYRLQEGHWVLADNEYRNTTYTVVIRGQTTFAGQRKDGILVSTDNGLTWNQMNSGLPAGPAGIGSDDFRPFGLSVSVTSEGQFLYAATTSGVWRWPLP
jgi:hypothetical protein